MRRQRPLPIIAAVISATLWAYACGDGTTEPTTPVPDLQRPTTVTVSPAPATVVEGDTLQLTATATNAHGQVVTGAEFVWASGDTAVAVVDASGLVTGVGAGEVQVTATAAGVTGRATLTVLAPLPTTIAVTPDTVVLTVVGQTAQLTAEVRDQAGRMMEGVPVAWSSGDTAVAVVDSAGLVSAVDSGAATITATAGEASGDAHVTVEINLDRVALVALYHATDGPNWVDNTNWLTDARLDEWYGVDTDAAGRVVGLDLEGRWDNEARQIVSHGLKGELPADLATLTELELLFLGHNDLTGAIPPELGGLTNLQRLGLSNNALSGAIPSELGTLANLQQLDLGWNRLTGPIPPWLGDLTNLWDLRLGYNQLTGPIPSELGNLARLEHLNLSRNELAGPIPPELGNLAELRVLRLWGSNLTGPIPRSFLQLGQLREFGVGGQDVCVPGVSAFVAWLEDIENRDTTLGFCNSADVAALKSLYQGTDGAEWTESGGWLSNDPVGEWYGVTADSLGHVTELDLEGNGLAGHLPTALADMARMTVLRVADNALSGRLPLSLTDLPLVEFRYSDTELCAPAEASFQVWLNAIASIEGTGINCMPLSDRDILEIFYNATGGPNWANNDNWLTDAPLADWYGVAVDGDGRVSGLRLENHNLTGRIPPELGTLTELTWLYLGNSNLTGRIPSELGNLTNLKSLALGANDLAGRIPPELGNLAELNWLSLDDNQLTGQIPPELGDLANLMGLALGYNQLSGRIPPELGNLANLTRLNLYSNDLAGRIPPRLGNLAQLDLLYLFGNDLTGPIPPELGNLANLRWLSLASNGLSGSVPPELGALTNVQVLELANNPALAGPLPHSLTLLDRLDELLTGGTGLCAPTDADFQAWLDGVSKRWIALCETEGLPAAYLTQAVQSREFPVPLIAGEKALLRVFPTVRQATSEGIPLVRARFYVDGRETHVQDIPGKSDPIPTEVEEGSLSNSANAEIAGWVIQPGLEMVIEVDPDGTLDPELGVAKRIPETRRLAVAVEAMPLFDLTLIPFIWTQTHDSSIVDLVGAMAADPQHHEMLSPTRTLLPIGALAVTAHEPVLSSSNNIVTLADQTSAIWVMEGRTGHYMGLISRPVAGPFAGVAGHWTSAAVPDQGTIAHELGHNLLLDHAPCGVTGDPSYPYPDGSIGAWGYDFRDGARLVRPSTPDLMSYCRPQWIGPYHFTNALRYHASKGRAAAVAAVAPSTRSLLVWGGVGADRVPYLEPAFVVDAPAALPDSAGEHRITGRTAGGGQLFSFSFNMPETADGDGSSSFAFALPVRARWEDDLATITLSGPGGSVTLDGESDIPMAILRDPRTGQVRGILRDPPHETRAAADGVGVSAPGAQGLEVLFSRGIPGAVAWRR